MNINIFLKEQLAHGRYSFTIDQAMQELKVSRVASLSVIRRKKSKGDVAEPSRGFYVIIPPEYQNLGCLPAPFFIDDLSKYLNIKYYVGLLSAANLYGAGHQKPQLFQVVISEKRRNLVCGKVAIQWTTNKSLNFIPTQDFKTQYGYIKISTPEATARDLVIYSNRCAGMNNVITVLNDLAEKINISKLTLLAETLNSPVTWIQRLGFCFDLLGKHELSSALYHVIKGLTPRTINLVGNGAIKKPTLNKKWHLYINEKLEGDKI